MSATVAPCAEVINGPRSVSGSAGSPTTILSITSATPGTIRDMANYAIVEVVRGDDDTLLDMLGTGFRAMPVVMSNEPFGYLKQADLKDNWGSQ